MISTAADYRYVDPSGFPITGHILPARMGRRGEKLWAAGFRKEDVLFLREAAIERGVPPRYVPGTPSDRDHAMFGEEIRRLCVAYYTRIRAASGLSTPDGDTIRFCAKTFSPPSSKTEIPLSSWLTSDVFDLFPSEMALPASHLASDSLPADMRAELLGRMYLDLNDLTTCYLSPTYMNGSDAFGGYFGEVSNATYDLLESNDDPTHHTVRSGSGSGNPTVQGSTGETGENKIPYTITYGDGRDPVEGTVRFAAYFRVEGQNGGGQRYAYTRQRRSFDSIDFHFRFDASQLYLIIPCRLSFREMTETGYPFKEEAFVFFDPLTKVDEPRSGYLSRWRLTSSSSRAPLSLQRMYDFLRSRGAHIAFAAGTTPTGPEYLFGELEFYFGGDFFAQDPGLIAVPTFRAEIASLNWNWTPPSPPSEGLHYITI